MRQLYLDATNLDRCARLYGDDSHPCEGCGRALFKEDLRELVTEALEARR